MKYGIFHFALRLLKNSKQRLRSQICDSCPPLKLCINVDFPVRLYHAFIGTLRFDFWTLCENGGSFVFLVRDVPPSSLLCTIPIFIFISYQKRKFMHLWYASILTAMPFIGRVHRSVTHSIINSDESLDKLNRFYVFGIGLVEIHICRKSSPEAKRHELSLQ